MFIDVKMIVTKRTRLPNNLNPDQYQKIITSLEELTRRAKSDKINVMSDFLYGDKEEYDDINNDDFHNVKFLGVFVREWNLFRYRIYPNKSQILILNEQLNLCKELYNFALEHRIMMYKFYNKTISYFDQCMELSEIKKEFPQYKKVHSRVLMESLNVLDKSSMSAKGVFVNISPEVNLITIKRSRFERRKDINDEIK